VVGRVATEDLCAICLDPCEAGCCGRNRQEGASLSTVKTQCGHVFHGACAWPLARDHRRCPICRSEVSWNSVHGIIWNLALLSASFRGDLPGVLRALERGGEVDVQSQLHSTPLILAAMQGHIEIVEELLKAHASVDSKTVGGKTALWAAGHQGHRNVARVLLSHGASPYVHADGKAAAAFPVVAEELLRLKGCMALEV